MKQRIFCTTTTKYPLIKQNFHSYCANLLFSRDEIFANKSERNFACFQFGRRLLDSFKRRERACFILLYYTFALQQPLLLYLVEFRFFSHFLQRFNNVHSFPFSSFQQCGVISSSTLIVQWNPDIIMVIRITCKVESISLVQNFYYSNFPTYKNHWPWGSTYVCGHCRQKKLPNSVRLDPLRWKLCPMQLLANLRLLLRSALSSHSI